MITFDVDRKICGLLFHAIPVATSLKRKELGNSAAFATSNVTYFFKMDFE